MGYGESVTGERPIIKKSKGATRLDNPGTVPGCKFPAWFVSQVWGIKVKYLHEFCLLTHRHTSLREGPLSYLCSLCWLSSQAQIRFYIMKEDTQGGVQLDSSPHLFIRGKLYWFIFRPNLVSQL